MILQPSTVFADRSEVSSSISCSQSAFFSLAVITPREVVIAQVPRNSHIAFTHRIHRSISGKWATSSSEIADAFRKKARGEPAIGVRCRGARARSARDRSEVPGRSCSQNFGIFGRVISRKEIR